MTPIDDLIKSNKDIDMNSPTDNFERKYMERIWIERKNKAYDISDIDKSIKDFYDFLNSKNVNGNLLDLGCGNGRNSIYFSKNGFESFGIDFALSAVKVCKESAKKENSNAKFVSGDVLKYPFEKNYFDVVVDAGCLHHIRKKHWKKYKNNLLNTIKEGGYFYLHGISDCAENKELPNHPNKRKWTINKKKHYAGFFSEEDIQKKFGKNFEIIETYQFKSARSPLTVRAFYMQKLI